MTATEGKKEEEGRGDREVGHGGGRRKKQRMRIEGGGGEEKRRRKVRRGEGEEKEKGSANLDCDKIYIEFLRCFWCCCLIRIEVSAQ